MITLEQLHQEAHDNDIEVFTHNFEFGKSSRCMQEGDFKAIIINSSVVDTNAKKRVALSHELAHFETKTLYYFNDDFNSSMDKLNRRKLESKANACAVNKILPHELIQKAIASGNKEDWEIAEYCEVTVEFLLKAMCSYQQKGICFADDVL